MDSLYRTVVERELKSALIILSIVPILLISILVFQCSKFASSLWVVLQFGYEEWQSYLLPVLGSLFVWVVINGIYFSAQFFIAAPDDSVRKALIGAGVGFVIGVLFVYFLVLVTGIVIFIPLGILSLVFPDVIQYATLAFTWLIASYISKTQHVGLERSFKPRCSVRRKGSPLEVLYQAGHQKTVGSGH